VQRFCNPAVYGGRLKAELRLGRRLLSRAKWNEDGTGRLFGSRSCFDVDSDLACVKSRVNRERRRHVSVVSTFHWFPTLGRPPYDGHRRLAIAATSYRYRGRRLKFSGALFYVTVSAVVVDRVFSGRAPSQSIASWSATRKLPSARSKTYIFSRRRR